MTPNRRHPRAFISIDAVWGISLAIFLLTTIVVAITQQRAADQKLYNIRASVRQLETTLYLLQAHQPAPAGAVLEKLPDPAPAGYVWVRISQQPPSPAPAGFRPQSLVGLIPDSGGLK